MRMRCYFTLLKIFDSLYFIAFLIKYVNEIYFSFHLIDFYVNEEFFFKNKSSFSKDRKTNLL